MATASSEPWSQTPQPPPMKMVDPRPISSPFSSNNVPLPPQQPPAGHGLALHLGRESQIPDHPGSAVNVPTRGHAGPPPPDVRNVRASAQFHVREYLGVRRELRGEAKGPTASSYDLDNRLRSLTGLALADLSTLQAEVRALGQSAQSSRWSRVLVGGAIAAFIPTIRRFFRRRSDQDAQLSSNDTEHAFRKSKGLMAGIQRAVLGGGTLAKVAMFVLAVLYIFQNEVTVRVARTLGKRLGWLARRLERGDADLDEADLRIFEGWRWRVLLW